MTSGDLVYWLDPWAWDKELDWWRSTSTRIPWTWLDLLHAQGWQVMLLPYDARIAGGPCDGGHVVAVETGEGRQFAALPPRAIPRCGRDPGRGLPGAGAGNPRSPADGAREREGTFR